MNTSPKHTPYDGSSEPFIIGLHPLDLNNWIEVDEHLPHYLQEKHKLMMEVPERVFVAETGSENAQKEVLELLVEYLPQRFPDVYSLSQNDSNMNIAPLRGMVELDDREMPDLRKAALLVQEDLVIMRKSEEGWRLVTACVCFPSSWILAEKFSKPMHEIHAPVPGFNEGTRNAMMIERIFDNLHVDQPAERFNWSIYSDAELFHDDRFGEHFSHTLSDDVFLRIEHQTLRKLPLSGDVLFTIRIHVDPVEALAARDDRVQVVSAFVKSLRGMNLPQLEYKGLDADRELLITKLEDVARGVTDINVGNT